MDRSNLQFDQLCDGSRLISRRRFNDQELICAGTGMAGFGIAPDVQTDRLDEPLLKLGAVAAAAGIRTKLQL